MPPPPPSCCRTISTSTPVRKWIVRLAVLGVVILIAAGTAAWALRTRALTAHRGYGGAEQFVDVPAGAGPRTIGARLVAAGVVRDDLTFRVALWLTGRARALKAGEYRFAEPMSAVHVAELLARGEIYTRPVTFREGLTMADMADDLRRERAGHARGVPGRRSGRLAHPRSRSRRHRSRGLPVSRHVSRAAADAGRHARGADGARLPRGPAARPHRPRRG